ncbi:MAG: hypothetical protein NT028_02205 [candidate division Zixibacteria bacterium]|nr:hypothetical protein [candidate division Zixibacteria bacterium]
MSKLRRYFQGHPVSFLTNVTLEQQPLLIEHIDLFHLAVETTRGRSAFEMVTWMVLPDIFPFWQFLRPASHNPLSILHFPQPDV